MNPHDPYRDLIHHLARHKINSRIANGKAEHAAALFEGMFRTAENEVCIFTRNLEPRVFDQPRVAKAAWWYMQNPAAKLNILVQDQSGLATREIVKLARLPRRKGIVQIRLAAGSYRQNDAKHFAVMDGRAFRFEFDHENCSAIANFNEPGVASELQTAFLAAFSMGTIYEA